MHTGGQICENNYIWRLLTAIQGYDDLTMYDFPLQHRVRPLW